MRISQPRFVFEPVLQAIAVLAALSYLVIRQNGGFVQEELIFLVQILTFGTALFVALRFLTGIQKAWESLTVILLIIFLLLDPNPTPWALTFQTLTLVSIVSVAIVSKYFLEIAGRPMVNPAILGILFGAVLGALLPGVTVIGDAARLNFDELFTVGGISVSWVALLLAIWIFWGLPKWNRTPVITAFFLACALLSVFLNGANGAAEFFSTDPFLYFFAAFLLTDLRTSPDDHLWQWGYGAFVAFLLFLPQVLPFINIPFIEKHSYLLALAVANIGLILASAWRLRH